MFYRSSLRPKSSVRNALRYRDFSMEALPRLRFPVLLVGLVLAVLLPTLAIGVVESEMAARQVRATTQSRLIGTTRSLAEGVGNRLAAHVDSLKLLANSPALDWPFDLALVDAALRRASDGWLRFRVVGA